MFKAEKKYQIYFEKVLQKSIEETNKLSDYIITQFRRLAELTEKISKENFWSAFPEILGVDARLALLAELIQFDDFSEEEIIRMVETDYRGYYKELCGYNLNTTPPPLMIFTIK